MADPPAHPPDDSNSLSGPGDDSALISEIEKTVYSSALPIEGAKAYDGLAPRELGLALKGQTFDDVQLEEYVGGGGMGAVFRGRDLKLQRTVAVKVLAARHGAGAENQRRFEVEAQSAARLDHPCIARVYSVGDAQGLRYIIFEYIEGANVRDLVATGGPISVSDTLGFAIQIADALEHAWRRDVVHRDIKPSNILITRDGRVKLVDMGLARLAHADDARHDLTSSGATIGTFDYIAPEQARDPRIADARSDIYSLGCTVFFMLTGRPPFPEGTALQKLLQHQGDSPPDLRSLRPTAPRDLSRIVARMLAKRPEDRYADPAALKAALLRLAQRMGVNAPGVTPVSVKWNEDSRLLRHAPWIAAVAMLLAAWLFWPWTRPPATPLEGFEPVSPPPATQPQQAAG